MSTRAPRSGSHTPSTALATSAGRELATELGRAKQARGLSFTKMAAAIPYSRASLERYVNGRMFPPRRAVRDIALVCHTDPTRLLALWGAADTAGRLDPAPRRPDPPLPARPLTVTFGAATALVFVVILLLLIQAPPWRQRRVVPFIELPQHRPANSRAPTATGFAVR
ncbi:helix-turn-helix domain-containing protein [Nocardia abscessus]|uniref:helix-turn-helix domain-containing protein n=1 Tax=Nocardia abscessus TaxID=120957 RepID=UPI0024540BDE|nr:helix-turn-helix transcriptional regulator [Nocardia abscessus]